jgi:phage gp29-like protein
MVKKITSSELIKTYIIDNTNLSPEAIDPILSFETLRGAELGSLFSLYETILVKELHLAGDLSKRIEDIVSLEWELKGKKKKDVKFVKQILQNLNIDDLIGELGLGIYYGLQIINIEWKNRIPKNWQSLPLNMIFYSFKNYPDKNICITDFYGNEHIISENDPKYLIYKEGNQSIEKSGIARKLLYFVSLKHFFQNSFANAVNEWGLKKIILYTTECGDDDHCLQKKAMDLNTFLTQQGIAVIQRGFNDEKDEVITIEPQNIDPSKLIALNSYFDRNISNMILGFDLGSDSGNSGSYALAKVQEKSKTPKIKKDSINIQQTVQTLINHIVKANNLSDVKFVFSKEKETLQEFLDNQLKLQTLGFTAPKKIFAKKFGHKIKRIKTPQQQISYSPNSEDLKKNKKFDPIRSYVENLNLDEVAEERKNLIDNSFQKNTKKEISFDNLLSDLTHTVSNQPSKSLKNILHNGFVNSQISGMINYNKE